jgi:hypothetical protein
MIPTKYKAKIPQTLSYPVGAEKISDVLASVPQLKDVSISFHAFNPVKHQKGRSEPYPILEVQYAYCPAGRTTSNWAIEVGWSDPRWEITVRPVPRELKNKICEELEVVGFPRLVKWMQERKGITGREGCERIAFLFDELQGKLQVTEFKKP